MPTITREDLLDQLSYLCNTLHLRTPYGEFCVENAFWRAVYDHQEQLTEYRVTLKGVTGLWSAFADTVRNYQQRGWELGEGHSPQWRPLPIEAILSTAGTVAQVECPSPLCWVASMVLLVLPTQEPPRWLPDETPLSRLLGACSGGPPFP